MADLLPNLQTVYSKWQSRNPYLNGKHATPPVAGGGDSWRSNVGGALRSQDRRRVGRERGRSRRHNGFNDADELKACSFYVGVEYMVVVCTLAQMCTRRPATPMPKPNPFLNTNPNPNGWNTVADLGFLEGVTSGTRRELRVCWLLGEFYVFVNYVVGIICNV